MQNRESNRSYRKKIIPEILSTCAHLGYMPGPTGTYGSLLAIPFVIISEHLHIKELMLLLIIPLAIWSSHKMVEILGIPDPSEIILDEVAGIFVTFFYIKISTLTLFWGFILFRIFDIIKPYPIRWLERNLSGGISIVIDDVAAGIYSNMVLRLFFL